MAARSRGWRPRNGTRSTGARRARTKAWAAKAHQAGSPAPGPVALPGPGAADAGTAVPAARCMGLDTILIWSASSTRGITQLTFSQVVRDLSSSTTRFSGTPQAGILEPSARPRMRRPSSWSCRRRPVSCAPGWGRRTGQRLAPAIGSEHWRGLDAGSCNPRTMTASDCGAVGWGTPRPSRATRNCAHSPQATAASTSPPATATASHGATSRLPIVLTQTWTENLIDYRLRLQDQRVRTYPFWPARLANRGQLVILLLATGHARRCRQPRAQILSHGRQHADTRTPSAARIAGPRSPAWKAATGPRQTSDCAGHRHGLGPMSDRECPGFTAWSGT